MKPLKIRPASVGDINSIQQIAQTTWPVAYGKILSTVQLDYMLNWMYSTSSLTHQMENGTRFFIAELNEKAIGFAAVSPSNHQVYKLDKLYVLPTCQKSGAGRALLQKVKDFALERKAKFIQLQVNRQNNAVEFYKKQGFSIIKEADFDIGHGYFMNDYVMQIDL